VIAFGQYIPRTSILHGLDPRIKIGATVALSLLVLQGGFLPCALISGFLVMGAGIGRISLKNLISAVRPAAVFIVLLFFLHLLLTDGTPLPPFEDGPVSVTREGLYQGILVAWQFALLLAGGALLTMSTSPSELVIGLEWLLRPLRVIGIRSHEIALMVSLALRFVPTFVEEMHRVQEAQMARGAVLGSGGPVRRARAASSLLIPVLLGAFRRADDLAVAMEARGYASGPRTHLHELRFCLKDLVAAGFVILVLASIFSSELLIPGP
jgi:biotin transport system permease protein/energy-coupling factor transport system permease protein